MKRFRAVSYLVLGFLIAWVGVALAASFSVSFTAGLDTTIQTKLIPLVNNASCARYGRPQGCTSANLVTGGCVAVAFPSKNTNTCTIYTQDAAGETTFLQDELNQRLVDRFAGLNATNADTFRTTCQALSAGAQNQICTDAGLASGCNPCP